LGYKQDLLKINIEAHNELLFMQEIGIKASELHLYQEVLAAKSIYYELINKLIKECYEYQDRLVNTPKAKRK